MDDRITITICGDGGCGKSSITLRVVRGQWTHDYDPTIEDSYSVTRTIDGTTYSLALTDTAGQEEYRGMWSAANLHSDAFLLVYDITSSESLAQLDYFAQLIDEEVQNRQEAGRCWPALMVVGNKVDLQGDRQVSARQGLQWAIQRGFGFMETSARESVNIEETFAALVKRVVEARRMFESGQSPEPLPSTTRPQTSYATNGLLGTASEKPQDKFDQYSVAPNIGPAHRTRPPKQSFWSLLKCW